MLKNGRLFHHDESTLAGFNNFPRVDSVSSADGVQFRRRSGTTVVNGMTYTRPEGPSARRICRIGGGRTEVAIDHEKSATIPRGEMRRGKFGIFPTRKCLRYIFEIETNGNF